MREKVVDLGSLCFSTAFKSTAPKSLNLNRHELCSEWSTKLLSFSWPSVFLAFRPFFFALNKIGVCLPLIVLKLFFF